MERPDGAAAPAPSETIARVLLAVAAASLAGLAVCAWGWHRAAGARVRIDQLTPEQRVTLTQELMAVSPGVFQWTWFEPGIGYTLKPGVEVDAWGDSFRANELGYRAAQAPRASNVFRVVFVGDSWTYGLGVRAEKSFPAAFARLADAHAGRQGPIEAWSLALPGYNLFNSLAALDYFFDRLRPDAVVVCPSSNDNDSTRALLPNGTLSTAGVVRDQFGDPHIVTYQVGIVDSHRYQARWRMSFERLRAVEDRLRRRRVPLLLFFLARWPPAVAHASVAAAGLTSPYVIAPVELTRDQWVNASNHGTPAANELYARMVYRGAARLLGWPTLPEADERVAVEVFDAPPPSRDWQAMQRRRARAVEIPDAFRPSPKALRQVAGRLNLWNGTMGRATTILIRPRPGARRLEVAVRRLAEVPSLYPLGLTVEIPSPAGGSRVVTTVPADGPEVHRFALDVPGDLEPGSTLDVVFVAERTVAGPRTLAPRSLKIESITADR